MTQALPSTIQAKNRLWAAIGGPVGLSTLSKGGGELLWVLAGKFALMGANAAVMLFLAKRLDLKTYGLLVITISAQLLISRMLMMGVDGGMVRIMATPDLRSREPEVVTAGLMVMICTSGALLLVWLLALPLLEPFGISGWVITSIVVGSIGTALVDYGYSFRLAHHQYPLAALSQGGTALWRSGITTIAATPLVAHPAAVFMAYHGVSLCSGLIQTLLMASVSWRWPDRSLIQRLLRYSFWLGKANVIVIFSLYQGTFLLMFLKDSAATGLFGLGLTLSLGFFAIYNAYSEYLSVRVRSVEHVKDLPPFLRRAVTAAGILMLACVPVIFVVATLMPWFLGPEWRDVVPIFVYLSASMVFTILQAPLVAACHYLLKPQLITLGWVIRVILIGVAGIILASETGAIGVAIAQLIGSALALLVLSWLVVGALRSAIALTDRA